MHSSEHGDNAEVDQLVQHHAGTIQRCRANGDDGIRVHGHIMELVGPYECKMNMFGTANENRTGADAKEEKNSMKNCTYETKFF